MDMEYLYKKLFISECENVRDGGGLVVQTETREQQEEGRRGGSSSVTCTLTVLPRRLADKLNKAHHQTLTHTLTAKLTLRITYKTGIRQTTVILLKRVIIYLRHLCNYLVIEVHKEIVKLIHINRAV